MRRHAGNPFWQCHRSPTAVKEVGCRFHQAFGEVAVPFAVADKIPETGIAPFAERPPFLGQQLHRDAASLAFECGACRPPLSRLDRQREVLQELSGRFGQLGRIGCAKTFASAVSAFAATYRLRVAQFFSQELHQAALLLHVLVHPDLLLAAQVRNVVDAVDRHGPRHRRPDICSAFADDGRRRFHLKKL